MPGIPQFVREAYLSSSPASQPGESARLVAEGESLVKLSTLNVEDRQTALEEFREGLSETFSDAWGSPVKVVFDFELGER